MRAMRQLAVVSTAVSLLALGACASAARPEAMAVSPSAVEPVRPGAPGYQSIRVEAVQGGGDTNPLWLSNVSNAEFKAALESSLQTSGYFKADGPWALTATMVDLQRPMAGFDLSVVSRVRYSVLDRSGAIVFDETVAATGTATMSDSLLAVERLRLANEASIKANITAFLARLRAPAQPGTQGRYQ